MFAVLLLNVAAYSQSLPANDSIKIAVRDMDNATIKMIEGKQAKAELRFISAALSACDTIKQRQKVVIGLYETNSVGLKTQNLNLVKISDDLKIIAKNEKSAGLRRGFFGFLKGFAVGVVVTSAVLLLN
jgi:hypothetical protein